MRFLKAMTYLFLSSFQCQPNGSQPFASPSSNIPFVVLSVYLNFHNCLSSHLSVGLVAATPKKMVEAKSPPMSKDLMSMFFIARELSHKTRSRAAINEHGNSLPLRHNLPRHGRSRQRWGASVKKLYNDRELHILTKCGLLQSSL